MIKKIDKSFDAQNTPDQKIIDHDKFTIPVLRREGIEK